MKKILSISSSLALLVSLAGALPAFADSFSIGNDNAERAQVDAYQNFTVVDTNHPASVDGNINQFSYSAANTYPFRFILVDGNNSVKWVSDLITPYQLKNNVFYPSAPISVRAGWNLGAYFTATGTIPFENAGKASYFTDNNSGVPVNGNALTFAGNSNRIYSMVANGLTSSVSPSPTPTPTNLPSVSADFTLGNDYNSRTQNDSYQNFTVIDTNHSASNAGTVIDIRYWATNTNPFRFVLVDSNNKVKWVSSQITPSATGANLFTPASSLSIQKGWNLGAFFTATGTIPFEQTGSAAKFTDNNSGLPTVGKTLTFAGSDNRTYSLMANANISDDENGNNDNDEDCNNGNCNCQNCDDQNCNCQNCNQDHNCTNNGNCDRDNGHHYGHWKKFQNGCDNFWNRMNNGYNRFNQNCNRAFPNVFRCFR